MAKVFYYEYPIAKQTSGEANDILGFNIAKLCFYLNKRKIIL
ncbi:hypothetical protein [Clostridium sp. UBA2485]|nr:hypothetical protein [Clostridium sp. UBA2485]